MATTFTKPSITLELAQEIVQAAVAHAKTAGGAFVVAIVDESGVEKALARMDGAAIAVVQTAKDKAYTAAGFGLPTDQWFDIIDKDQPLRLGSLTGIPRFVVFGGGYPITVDGKVIGGIGVSGGHYSQDMEVAKAGLAVLQG